MVLKSVSARVFVGVSPEVGKINNVVLPAYSGSALDRLPDLRAESIGAANGIDVERVSSKVRTSMSCIVTQRDWRLLPHQAHDIN